MHKLFRVPRTVQVSIHVRR